MNKKIHFLPDECIDQIAAGEVIERPASVVKELVENTLDAGATRIDILLEEGGKRLVQVSDNGSGIAPEDMDLCALRHATSKITQAADLFGLHTHGFRGEALASIAAISKLTITSRTEENPVAIEWKSEPGSPATKSEAARERGTTIRVEELFCNAPVRARFLGSTTTETGRILDIVQRIALANPESAFRLRQGERELLNVRPGTHLTRMQEIFSPDIAKQMHPVDWSRDGMRISGFIGDELTHRARRQHQFVFLDRRPIWNAALFRAISQGTEALHAHPAALLFLSLPPEEVDINVHPAKREVRFAKESELFTTVVRALREALAQRAGWKPSSEQEDSALFPPLTPSGSKPSSWNSFAWRVEEQKDVVDPERAGDLFAGDPTAEKIIRWPQQRPLSSHSSEAPPPIIRPMFQVGMSYIAAEAVDGLLLIDQSAAHQKVIFEKARIRLQLKESLSQQLMFPELLELTPAQNLWMESCSDLLKRLGFELEPFGTRTWQLRGVPQDLQASDAARALREMAEDAAQDKNPAGEMVDALARSYARRTAIPSFHSLAHDEIARLVDDLFLTDNPYIAPDGRTVVLKLSLQEIEESFRKGRTS